MRVHRVAGATAVALALVACTSGDDGAEDLTSASVATSAATTAASSTAGTTVPAPTLPATAVTAVTIPATSATAPTTPAPTTVAGPTPAEDALAGFVAATDAVMADAAELWPIVDGARGTGQEYIPEDAWGLVDDITSAFYGLAASVPHGLDPTVREAAIDVIYDVGNHVAPFVFAPGFDFVSWDPAWDTARSAGLADYTDDRAALLDAAAQHGEVRAVDPQSQEVAEDAVLEVVVVRSFGHNLAPDPWPYAVRWLGQLPAVGAESDVPFCANVPFEGGSFTGSFVDGVGGCAIVYYDTTDPQAHEAELAAFLEDPSAAMPPGEIVSVVWDEDLDGYVVYGSAE